ncbi:MAG: 2Fe-2S iron-sulfur cluster-binding protein [Christensenellales bacterium]|nr:2Fe-2S iron-sulfur cluster-binding protein [Christensenellales bacterium]
MIVTIKRQINPDSDPYWQSFRYSGTMDATVASVLDALNYTDDLYDINGNPAPRIRWECSCMQNVCGGCAMIINGKPALACNTTISNLVGESLRLEPLSKFPVVADLIVNRSIIEENLRRSAMYQGQLDLSDNNEYDHQYSVAKCMKCGLCLEVCPNYDKGQYFYGALFANNAYLLHSQSLDRKAQLKSAYDQHFASGCSKSLSCQKICPAGISTLSSMLKMNAVKRPRAADIHPLNSASGSCPEEPVR